MHIKRYKRKDVPKNIIGIQYYILLLKAFAHSTLFAYAFTEPDSHDHVTSIIIGSKYSCCSSLFITLNIV